MLTTAPPVARAIAPNIARAIARAIAPAVASAGAGEPRACRVRLTPGPIAAAQARRQVRLALAAWDVPVDADTAVLLTSDLVTYAIRHAPGGAVTLGVRCTRTQLTVDVHDSATPVPAQPGGQPGPAGATPASSGPGGPAPASSGLALVARLSSDWGSAQTPAGLAVYFTLAFAGDYPGDRSSVTREPAGPAARRSRASKALTHTAASMTSTPTHAAAV
jgi:serine/threonine-protein kinase RsbW